MLVIDITTNFYISTLPPIGLIANGHEYNN